jgi:membrane protein implicated in regulation of membrane protease activity
MKEAYLIWTIAAFALITIELMTGTFYLLVLGVGAFGGAIAAVLGAPFIVQVLVSGVLAGVGTVVVHQWHKRHHGANREISNQLDLGQSVTVVSVSDDSGLLRIKYRGAEWDALAHDDSARAAAAGATLFICGQKGQVFEVTGARS